MVYEGDLRVDELLRDFKFLKEKRQSWESVWKDLADMYLPRRSFWDDNPSDGKRHETKVYESTGRIALQTMTDGLQGYSVSPSFRWFRLKMAREGSNDLPGVADWLEEVEDIIYSEFNRSNFYESLGEYFLDGGGIGTATLYAEDDDTSGRIVFSCRHPKECYISQNHNGTVDTLWRRFRMRLQDIVAVWGEDVLPDSLRSRYKERPYETVVVIHGVFPRKIRDKQKIDDKNKAYTSVYILEAEKEIINEGGYDEFPYFVWRWRTNSDELYGRSVALDVLPDVLRLNQMAKTMLLAGERSVNPPLNVPSGMKGRERVVPGGYNYYDQAGMVISPIQSVGNFPFGYQEMNDLRNQVKEAFHVSFFLMLESITTAGKMTATEVAERQGEKAAILGVIIGRLNSECLGPLINRVFRIMMRRQEIPAPPQALLQAGGGVSIEFMGPLAQAQRRYHRSQGVNAAFGLLGSVVQLEAMASRTGSQAIDNADLDELTRIGLDAAGAPQKGIREVPERDKGRQARAQAAAAAEAKQVGLMREQLVAQNANKLNEPIKQGAPLEDISKQLGAALPTGGGQ